MLVTLMISAFAVMAAADVDPSYVAPRATTFEGFNPAAEGIDLGPDESDNSGGLIGTVDLPLKPGDEYRYQLYLNGEKVDDETLKLYNFRISAKKGSGTMSSFSIVKRSGLQMLVAEVKSAWPTTTTEVEYEIRAVDRKTGSTAYTYPVSFETGYRPASDESIAGLSNGDEIVVDPTRPVYTKEQLEKIASVNNYRNVTFVGDDWRYTTNVTDMKGINMLFNYNGVKEILGQYPDNDFEFISFPAGTSFAVNGKFELDVSDFAEDYNNKFYVYRYLTGKLTQLTTKFDTDDNYLTFNTNTLGRFIISDRALSVSEVEEPEEGGDGNNNGGNDNGENPRPNPGTGAVA